MMYVPNTFPHGLGSITAAVRRARMGRKPKSGKTLSDICHDFMESPRWLLSQENGGYAETTKRAWRLELNFACRDDIIGRLPISELWPGVIREYLAGWADKPAKQRNALDALKQLDVWMAGLFKEHRSFVYGLKRPAIKDGHTPWSDEQVAIGEKYARSSLSRIITLGANSGQRGSDLVRMGWSDLETFRGMAGINVTQKKTGRKLWIPVNNELAAAMATWERLPGPFCRRADGKLWTREELTVAWAHERDHNPDLKPLAGLVLHGLRGHACVRLFRAGKNPKEIGTLVGMSTTMVESYTRLSQQKLDAMAAIYDLENFRGTKLNEAENK